MAGWTDDELDRLSRADELRIAGLKEDGSLRKLTIIWAVRVSDELYVRSVNGPHAAWFRGTQVRHEGRIESGGVAKDVRFIRDADHDAEIDAAYRQKYGTGSAVLAIISATAIETTLRVDPLDRSLTE